MSVFLTFGPVKKVGSPVSVLMGPVQKNSNWSSELFLEQVEEAVSGLHKKYPEYRYDLKFTTKHAPRVTSL